MAMKLGAQGQAALNKAAVNMAKLDIQRVAIDSVQLWADNPRQNDKAVPKVADSLKEHGQRKPIVVWRQNMTVYAGNTTYKAAKHLGWTHINVAFADFPSEQAAIAYGIADNKTSEYSDWDDTVLSALIRADEGFFNKTNTAMSDRELAGLKMGAEKPEALPAVDIEGQNAGMGEFVVIQFETAEECAEFKEMVGMGTQERTLLFSDLRGYLGGGA